MDDFGLLFVGGTDPREFMGFRLVEDTIRRFALAGFPILSPDDRPPLGPLFAYSDGPDLFCGRRGVGPLLVALDTNLLIDYFTHGRAIWELSDFPAEIDPKFAAELDALRVILALWVARDVRLSVLPRTLSDSKKKTLAFDRVQQRRRAFDSFVLATTLVANCDEGVPEDVGNDSLLRLPDHLAREALSAIPAGNDRVLVKEALAAGVHVFLTRDDDVLACRDLLRRHGLLLASPSDLIEDLAAAGALQCFVEPRALYWPAPDQYRVAHLLDALGSDGPRP